MTKDNVIEFKKPETFVGDPITDVLRTGARKLLAEAQRHFDNFISIYEAKYPRATEFLKKDRAVFFTFYDVPAEHWRHTRTTNPVESTFSTVRLRTDKVRSGFSSKTILTMALKLCQGAQNRWQRLYGHRKLGKVIRGVKFKNGIEGMQSAA